MTDSLTAQEGHTTGKIDFITAGDVDETAVGESIWLPANRYASPGILLDIHRESLQHPDTGDLVEVVVLQVGDRSVTTADRGVTYCSTQHVLGLSAPVVLSTAIELVSTIAAFDPGRTGATQSMWTVHDQSLPEGIGARRWVTPLPRDVNDDWFAIMGSDYDSDDDF